MNLTPVLIGYCNAWGEFIANHDKEGGDCVFGDEKGNGVYSTEWLSGKEKLFQHIRGGAAELKLGKEKGVRIRPESGARMLENKRERLKTFLRKIDEKTIFGIKHLMKER